MKKIKNLFFSKNENGDSELNKQVIITFVSVLATVMCTIGVSLAAFVWSDNSEKEQNLIVGNLELTISSDSNSLGSELDFPVADSDAANLTPYTFTIKNTGNLASNYSLKIVDDEAAMASDGCLTNKIDSNYIKFSVSGAYNTNPEKLSSYDGKAFTSGVLLPNESKTYNIKMWISSDAPNSVIGKHYHGKILLESSQIDEVDPFKDKSGANAPVLAEGMIPVRYDEINDTWVKTDVTTWYNYGNQMWANAVMVKENASTCEVWDGVLGDVNKDGDLTQEDVDNILRKNLGIDNTGLTDQEWLERGDINKSGSIDASDAGDLSGIINELIPYCDTPITSKSRQEYLDAEPGTPIEKNDILQFFVWIPRYKYRITSNVGSSSMVSQPPTIDVVFEQGVASTGVSINTSGVAKTEYYTHPAFRDGSKVYKTTAYDQGGWDKELSGFWVDKFENSLAYNTDLFSGGSIKDIIDYYNDNIISYVPSTHMMKNTEWGAIAYLSQSKYGKMGNNDFTGVNKEVFINSSEDLISGRSGGGVAGGNVFLTPDAISTLNKQTYSYDGYSCSSTFIKKCKGEKTTLRGTGASTTGNIYGIYDMVGGMSEYVMANYNNSLGSSGLTNADFFTTAANKKLYDSYTPSKTYILGDATYETSHWYSDTARVLDTDNPFYHRGGLYSDKASAGLFNFAKSTGEANDNINIRYITIP